MGERLYYISIDIAYSWVWIIALDAELSVVGVILFRSACGLEYSITYVVYSLCV